MHVIFKLRSSVTGPQFISADDVGASPQMAYTNKQGVTPCINDSRRLDVMEYHMVMSPSLWIQYCVERLITSSPMQHHCASL